MTDRPSVAKPSEWDADRELAELRVAEEVERRRRASLARDADAGSLTTNELLSRLAGRGAEITVRMADGSWHSGVLGAACDGWAIIESAGTRGWNTALCTDAIATLRTDLPLDSGHGRGPLQPETTLTEILVELVGSEVRLATTDGTAVTGRLASVGIDVLEMAAEAAGPRTYVWLTSLSAVSSPDIS